MCARRVGRGHFPFHTRLCLDERVNARSRNAFLIALAVIAILGIAAIALLMRPKAGAVAPAALGAPHSVTFTSGGKSQTVQGFEVTGNPVTGARFQVGQAGAPVKVVEYANYQCYYCAQFEEKTQPAFLTRFVRSGLVQFYYRDYVIAEYPDAFKRAAAGASCASDQNKYWEFHDALYRVQTTWGPLTNDALDRQLEDYASQLGLDTPAFTKCLQSGQNAPDVLADNTAGLGFGVKATPSFIINGVLFEGAQPIEFFDAAVKGAQAGWK